MALLDTLIQVHAERLREASTNDKIAAEMAKLPVPTLLKVASGEVKLGFGCLDGEDFLKEFAGSPLQQQALQLEEQGIQLEMEQMQRRAAERKAEQAFDYYEQRDALRLQKKMLILQLRKEQAATGAAPPPVTPSTPSTGTDEAYQEAMKSAADKILEQRAYAEHLQALALQKTAKSDKEYNTSDKVRLGRNVGAVLGALPGVVGFQQADPISAVAGGLKGGLGGAGIGGLAGLLHDGPSTAIDEEIRKGRNAGAVIGGVLGGGEGYLRGGGLLVPTGGRALAEGLKGGVSGALRGAVYGAGAKGLLHLDEETPAVKKAFDPSAAFASAKGVVAKAIPAAKEWASKALPAAKDVAINTVKANPAAAAGAVVGGGLGMASELGKKPEDRSFLRAAGKGVVGAGVGAGIGHFGQKSLTKTPGAAVAPVAPPPPVPAT